MKHYLPTILTLFFALLLSVAATAQDRTVTGTVSDKTDGTTMPGVTIRIKDNGGGASTGADGSFSIQVPAKATTLIFSSTGYTTVEIPIPASNVVLVSLEADANVLGEVVISTGSRSSQRTITDAPIPIDIFSATELRSTGQTSFDKALQYRVPSFNTVNTPVNDATALLDPYEIRNMGPSRTLILVNGKRKNPSALVYIQTSPGRGESGADLASIPTDAIKRVEILRDGASAQYGSDAIAGVMNIILKDRSEYGSVTINTGVTSKGDGETFGFSLNNGVNLGDRGYVNYTAAFSTQAIANRPGTVDASGEAADFGADIGTVQSFLSAHPDAGNVNGQPANTQGKFLINVGLPIGETGEWYANAAYVAKKVNSFANYRTPYWRPFSSNPDGFALLSPNGQESGYQGYVPTFEGDLSDYSGTVGFRTENTGWKSDFSFTTGGNQQLYTVSNTVNRALGGGSPVTFKPGGYSFSHNVFNIDVSKAFRENLVLGLGSEFRAEKFGIQAGDTSSYVKGGADSFPGIDAPNAGESNRYNFGGYVDLGWDITPAFLINGTVRLEKYSDLGRPNGGKQSSFYQKAFDDDSKKLVYKVSSRYKLAGDRATIRASYSTGFRAPSLHQANLQIAQASFVPGQGIQTKGIFNNRSAQVKALGVPQLKPESSTNFTAGIGLQPSRNFNISLDYYYIKVKDRIILSSEIGPTDAGNTQLDQVLANNGIVAISFFTNGINTITSGIDLVASYRNIALGSGKLGFNVAGNYTLQSELDGGQASVITPQLIKDAGRSVFDETQEALLLTSRPRFKAVVGIDFGMKRISVNLNNTVFGPTTFRQAGLSSLLKTEFKTKVVTDLGITLALSKKIDLGINVQNLLNVLPEWQFKARENANTDAANALLNDRAALMVQSNLITFNQRYAVVTYDGSHFSQLGTTLAASLTWKF